VGSLIEQLQEEALNTNVTITSLLRKANLCAVKLGLNDAASWINHELNGYPPGVKLPDYRRPAGSPQYRTTFHGWLPLRFADAGLNEMLSRTMLGHPIAEIEELLSYDQPVVTYHAEQIEMLRQVVPAQFTDAGAQLGNSVLAGLLSAVRNRVSDWAIQLEMAGVKGEGNLSFSKHDREAAATVTYNISVGGSVVGNVGPVSGHGTVNATQVGAETIRRLTELADQVTQHAQELGLSSEDTASLERDAAELKREATSPMPDPSKLGRVLAHIGSIAEKAAGSLLAQGLLHVLGSPAIAALVHRVAG
jgi:AbiTii